MKEPPESPPSEQADVRVRLRMVSPLLYAAAIPLAFLQRYASLGIYVFVALMWLVPDRRIESRMDA